MADVAGLLASAIITQVGAKLGSIIGDQVSMICCFEDDMEDMKDTLETVGATLEDAEKRSIKEKEVRLWLKRLKNAALDISDMIDEFGPDSNQTDGKMMGIFSYLDIAPKITMANKMKKMRDQLRKIKEDHQSFKFEPYHRIENEHHFIDRETTSKVNEAGIIGRDKERRNVIELLSVSNDTNCPVILPIFGLGGIGKTTLAQLIFNHIHFNDYDHRIWVYVSQVFDLRKIGNTIISQVLKEGRHNGESKEFIYQRLQELLNDKKTLIILDDLWETDASQLNELKLMLNVSSKMKVLVTTRNEEIANMICSIKPFRLSPLDNDLCWDIIKKNTKFESREDRQQVQKFGQTIANKCGGVPLAAQALGFMLSRMDLKQWEEVSNSDIWNEPFPENSVLPSLKLTYIAMPPYLRLCFSYCAIFPRGHIIAKDYLMHQWVALDFIEPSKIFSNIQLAEKYVGQLLGMSFLQNLKVPMTDQKQSLFTMHDLVYDLARSVIGEELIVYDPNKVGSPANQKYSRYALLTNCSKQLNISTILPAKLRALLFHDCSELGFHGGAFSFAKCLRVMDLTESSIRKFPSSIDHLKQLRFLIAPALKNRRFPVSISGLSKLQYIDIHGSSRISALPESIGKLDCLMHLDLSGCTEIVKMPESLGKLKKLLHLELSSCSSLEGIPETTSGLTCLEYINLSGCSNLQRLPQDLGSLVELQYFNVSRCSKITELPASFGKLTNLVHLDLSRCSFVVPIAIGGLRKLKYLNLSGSLITDRDEAAEYRISYICTLTNLYHLDLSYSCISSLPQHIGNLKRLHTLNVSGCTSLTSLPKSIGSIDSLEVLVINECSEILKDYIRNSGLKCNPFPHLIVRPNHGDSGSNLQQLKGVNTIELEISNLENVRILGEVSRIELCNKENLSKLVLHWARVAARCLEDRVVLEELVPPTGLKYLVLEGYSSISFPNWLSALSSYLPNLVSIHLKNLPRCSLLPPLGQLSNLRELYLERLSSITKINEDFCGGKAAFRRLSTLFLQHMDQLDEWNTQYCDEDGTVEFMFPMLNRLLINACPRLRLKTCPPTFQYWHINGCDKVLNSGEEVDNFSHLNSSVPRIKLTVWYGGRRSNVSWRLLHHLPTLQELEINDSYRRRMTSLPESMRQLSSLRSLRLFSCYGISMLPEWLGDLKSLECLSIMFCGKIKAMPSSIQQLTKLQNLDIVGHPELRKWCESEENKMKLAHIKNIYYAGAKLELK
ncbi:unnamed protein product [Urochloa decumbens]|uniref:Uncharacterized protein n=1 Tax=Urochloa decumbens TaxID=240449 RepID=A0ABC9BW13_9POAL